MKLFTGLEWLYIDVATQFGHDKLTFEERIEWTTSSMSLLEGLTDQADAKTRPQYQKAVMALRRAQKGLPTGHLVGVDAVCSGIQIMSVLTGCVAGATATGLVLPDVRPDAYTSVTDTMKGLLGSNDAVSRMEAKEAVMTTFYGSKLVPETIFGEDTPELAAFYEACNIVAPGAAELLGDLLNSWKPYALLHEWRLPDGFDARVKVMQQEECRIEVDELDHSTFTYTYYDNRGSKRGLSNAANVVHSVDAYICRTMHRRCNYDKAQVALAAEALEIALLERSMGTTQVTENVPERVAYYIAQYERSGLADVVILPYLRDRNLQYISTEQMLRLSRIVAMMLEREPFELVTIHDEFKAHCNNINRVRFHYKEILAELADSRVLDDLLSQLYQTTGTFPKKSKNLGALIRKSNYALC